MPGLLFRNKSQLYTILFWKILLQFSYLTFDFFRYDFQTTTNKNFLQVKFLLEFLINIFFKYVFVQCPGLNSAYQVGKKNLMQIQNNIF